MLIVDSLLCRFMEPLVPSYMYKKLEAFKKGARSGNADCTQLKCKLPFIG